MWVFALKPGIHFLKSLFQPPILHRQIHMFTINAGINPYRNTLELEWWWNTANGSNDSQCFLPSIHPSFVKPPLTPDRGQSLSQQNTVPDMLAVHHKPSYYELTALTAAPLCFCATGKYWSRINSRVQERQVERRRNGDNFWIRNDESVFIFTFHQASLQNMIIIGMTHI